MKVIGTPDYHYDFNISTKNSLIHNRAIQRDYIRRTTNVPAEHLRGVRLVAVPLLRNLQRGVAMLRRFALAAINAHCNSNTILAANIIFPRDNVVLEQITLSAFIWYFIYEFNTFFITDVKYDW